jgi:undecaprenyl-diphosphatase
MGIERVRLRPAVASASCLFLFICVAAAVASGATMHFDNFVRSGIHSWASAPLTRLAYDASLLGSVPVLTSFFTIGLAAFLLARRFQPAIALASAMAGAIVLDNVLKYALHRARPAPFFGTAPASYSFPSGHVLFSSCFYGTLSFILTTNVRNTMSRTAVWALTALLVSTIGWSRIYLGFHYPSDVIGGPLIAMAWMGALKSVGLLEAPPPRMG